MVASLLASLTILLNSAGALLPDMDAEESTTRSNMSLDVQNGMPDTSLPGRWLYSFKEARSLAATQQVPLIVHFEATWCGPCRQMDSGVLGKPDVIRQLTSSFVGVRIDADRHPELISEFSVASLPTEIVLNSSGEEIARFVGIAALDSYVRRLQSLSTDSLVASQGGAPVMDKTETDEKLRSCLLIQRDGKTVGLGGFSPVALVTEKVWEKGSEEFVASYEGVEYFFKSEQERQQFRQSPQDYIPRLHGCDPVALFRDNRAAAGAIEYGAFYKGQLFFFASLKNRERFQSNPDWYATGVSGPAVQNSEQFPFLRTSVLD